MDSATEHKVIRLLHDHPAMENPRIIELLKEAGFSIELVSLEELGQEQGVWTKRAMDHLLSNIHIIDTETTGTHDLETIADFEWRKHTKHQEKPWYRQAKRPRSW